MTGLAAVRSFATRGTAHAAAACDLCGGAVSARHGHVWERRTRALRCACAACVLLLADGGGGGADAYAAVIRRLDRLDGTLDGPLLASLAPVALAALVRGQDGTMRALYPGAAGIVEGDVTEDAAAELSRRHPEVAALRPDVDAVLVVRGRVYVASLDVVYELASRVREAWAGGARGREVDAAVDALLETAS